MAASHCHLFQGIPSLHELPAQRYSNPAHSGGGPQPLMGQQYGSLPSGQDPPPELPLGSGRDWTPSEPTSLLNSRPCPYLLPMSLRFLPTAFSPWLTSTRIPSPSRVLLVQLSTQTRTLPGLKSRLLCRVITSRLSASLSQGLWWGPGGVTGMKGAPLVWVVHEEDRGKS